jgi:hypothetical protein
MYIIHTSIIQQFSLQFCMVIGKQMPQNSNVHNSWDYIGRIQNTITTKNHLEQVP